MIVKINNSDDISAILGYNLNKVEGEVAHTLSSNCLSADASFMQYLNLFRNVIAQGDNKVKNVAKHIVINPAENDLPDERLDEIAKDYIKQMGLENAPYVIVKHEDIDKTHLHIVTTNVDFQGNSINREFEKKRSNEIRKRLEEKYNLQPAEAEQLSPKEKIEKAIDTLHSFIDDSKLKPEDAVHYGQKDLVKSMRRVLRYVTKMYKYQDLNELNKILRQYNIKAKVVDGKKREGEDYKGIVFYTLDDEEEKKGLSGSTISKQFAYPNFEKKFEEDKKYIKNEKDKIKLIKETMAKQISRTLNQYKQGISYEDFKSILYKNGLDVQYSINKDGRLLGVSFVNNVKGIVFKLSDLDKELQEKVRENLSETKVLSNKERYEQMQKVSKMLRELYDKEKKETYFFESEMIENLDAYKEKFRDLLEIEGFIPEIIDECINNYADYKKKELENIKSKELGYFEYQVHSVIEQAERLNVPNDMLASFFLRNNIMYDGKRFYHRRSEKVGCEAETKLRITNNTEIKEEKPFGKDDKKMLEMVSADRISDIGYDNIHLKPSILKYLGAEEESKLSKQITINYADKILNANSNQDITIQIALLKQRGLMIVPQKNEKGEIEYFIGRYDDARRVGFVKMKPKYNEMLDKANYPAEYQNFKARNFDDWGNPTNKYRAISEIGIAIDSKNDKKIDYEIKRISKFNPLLAVKLNAVKHDKAEIYALLADEPSNLGEVKGNGYKKKL